MNVNVGCGRSPTPGWRNYDNSLTLRLARWPVIVGLLRRLGLLDDAQAGFARATVATDVEWADATALPLPDTSADTVYSSHMLEHLSRVEAERFLVEARRILKPGGVLRVAVPDVRRAAERYLADGEADAFVARLHMVADAPRSVLAWLRLMIVGPRQHQWMYDGKSLVRLLERFGFESVTVVAAGTTRIESPGGLNLREREEESV